jgi:AcrR family transcriptional regulator
MTPQRTAPAAPSGPGARTRQRILEASERLMRTIGLARVTTKEIARAADCSEATLYKYFTSKEELFVAVLEERLPSLGSLIAELTAAAGETGGTTGPGDTTEPRSTAEPESTTGPQGTIGPEHTTEPESTTGPRSTTGPHGATKPEDTTGPQGTTGPEGAHATERALADIALKAARFYESSTPLAASLFAEPALLQRHVEGLRPLDKGPHKPVVALADYLRAEQAHGRLRPDTDPDAAAVLLLGACYQRAFLRLFLGESAAGAEAATRPAEEFAASLARTLMRGIGQDPSSHP